MSQGSPANYTEQLRSLMQQVGISSFKALSLAAGVSDWQVRQLRQGHAAQMQLESLHKLSQALQISLLELLTQFSTLPLQVQSPAQDAPLADSEALKQEYQRLQVQLANQKASLKQEFQQASLQTLESLLLQLPTAIYAAQQNPQIPASRLVPLLRPLDQLLGDWGVESIAPVGTELPYDPQLHQLLDGTAHPGDLVRVRYTGYRQGEKLLYRAQVSPISPVNKL